MSRHRKEDNLESNEEILKPEEELPAKEPEHVPDLEKIQKELAEEKAKAESYLAGWQRAQADFANYKRRVDAEKEDTIKYANNSFILKILPVLDDFERAFAAMSVEESGSCIYDGMKLVERKLKSFLESQGVSEIEALGEPFDPNVHEAVTQTEGEDGIVTREFEKGYKINDRVIRPSKVAVGSGMTAEQKEE